MKMVLFRLFVGTLHFILVNSNVDFYDTIFTFQIQIKATILLLLPVLCCNPILAQSVVI